MKIISGIYLINLIYNSLIKYWRALVVLAFCGFLQVLALVFPHVFTYRLGRNIFFATVLIALYFDYLNHLLILSEKLTVRLRSFYEKYFLLILLCAISFFSIGALNEKLFDSDPAIHSLNYFINHHITVGGVIPHDDNAQYLTDIQSFLKYGVMQSIGIYRPLGHLVAAIIYKLSGENIITYFYLTSVILIIAIFWFGRVLKRHFNGSIALVTTFGLCLFFSRVQGSFMTELIGGIVGLFAFAALLDSIFLKNVYHFFMGIVLLGLAFQIRAGAIFILPLLVLYGAIYFRKRYWVCIKTLFVGIALMVTISFSSNVQLSLFSRKIDTASNIGCLLYQIQVNSETYKQVWLDYPEQFHGLKGFDGLKPYESAKLANEIAFNSLKDNPYRFVVHYVLTLIHAIKTPGIYTFCFTEYFPEKAANIFLILFLITPVLYKRNSKMHLFFWFLLIGLAGSVLSSPLLEVARLRLYAASIGLNVMIFAVSIANLFLILQGFYYNSSGLHWDFYYKWKLVLRRFKDSASQNWKRNGSVQWVPRGAIIYLIIALIILIGPVMTDKLRNYKAPHAALIDLDSLSVPSEKLFLLSIRDSPHALFDPLNDFIIKDPLVISRTKFLNNTHFDAMPHSRFYLFNALDHIDFLHTRQYCNYLILSEALLGSIKLEDVSSMLLKGEYIVERTYPIFLAKEICKVTLQN